MFNSLKIPSCRFLVAFLSTVIFSCCFSPFLATLHAESIPDEQVEATYKKT
ncbi:MAG: hypothetical protein JSR39_10480, partial [Verrucomicrobia bacterium]|nr:hypothetical protein [Verrucomicrobiota bacterium]